MQRPIGLEDAAEGAKPGVGIGQVMEHAGADDLVELLAELSDVFDRQPMEFQIAQFVFALQLARVAEARLADVNSRHMSVRLAHRVSRGLRGAAAGDEISALSAASPSATGETTAPDGGLDCDKACDARRGLSGGG